MVLCCRCGQAKPVSDFAKDASKANGRKSLCKTCDNAKSRAYYERNREKVIARAKAWQDRNRPKNPPRLELAPRDCEVCGESFVPKRSDKRICYRSRCRNRGLSPIPKWRRQNHVRRERMCTSDVLRPTKEHIAKLLATKDCPACGVEMNDIPNHPAQRHLDHEYPLGIGGANSQDNVRVLCRTCNLKRPKDGSDIVGQISLFQLHESVAATITPKKKKPVVQTRDRRTRDEIEAERAARKQRALDRQIHRGWRNLAKAIATAATLQTRWERDTIVKGMRSIGWGHNRIARHLGVTRDTARDIIRRIEKDHIGRGTPPREKRQWAV